MKLAGLLLLIPLVALAAPPTAPAGKGGPRHGTGVSAAPRGGPAGLRGGAAGVRGGPAGAAVGARPGLRRANGLLRQGYYRAAAEAFRSVLGELPDDPEAHIGLGTALARMGKCDAALGEFVHWSDARAFGARHALLAAGCAARQGFAADALEFDLLAQARNPANRTALARIALDAQMAGEPVVRDVAVEYLWYVSATRDESLFVEAALALNRGDIDEFDAIADQWSREGRSVEEFMRLQAQSWLDLGEPGLALESMLVVRRMRRGEEARIILAEANRRVGQPSDAWRQLSSPMNGTVDSAAADAVRARIAIDQGDLATADTIAAENQDVDDEDWSATEWYLARAHGDTVGMAAAADRYAAVVSSPLRTLEQLLPIVGAPPAGGSNPTR